MKILLTRKVKTPHRGTPRSAGIDFFVPDDYQPPRLRMRPGESALIPSGVKCQVPSGYALVLMNKSGVSTKRFLSVGACVVDEDYQGEIHLHVFNYGTQDTDWPKPGEKLVQGLLIRLNGIYEIDQVYDEEDLWLGSKTERGDRGFGSTGTW